MPDDNRRDFLKNAGVGVAAIAAGTLSLDARADDKKQEPAAEAQDTLVIGCGGQAMSLLRSFVAQPDVRIACVCDPEAKRAADAAQAVESATGKRCAWWPTCGDCSTTSRSTPCA